MTTSRLTSLSALAILKLQQTENALQTQVSFKAVQFTEKDVIAAIHSFPAGSAGGPDGVRPQHLRDLTSNKESGPALITSLTAFINLLMLGKCPSSVASILFGGRLIALQKKSGGIRPIAIGYSVRRLASKCVNKHALSVLKDTFAPSQLGVGVSGGCEAAVHAARRFLTNMPENFVVVKLDFANAFNCIRRDSVLSAVANFCPKFTVSATQPIIKPPSFNVVNKQLSLKKAFNKVIQWALSSFIWLSTLFSSLLQVSSHLAF